MVTSNSIQPWIRRTNYFQDYFETLYETYIREYPAYFISYYSIDRDNTIWEDDTTIAGSYEKHGVGTLTGVKFKKIFMFPVFGIQAVEPTPDSSEQGGLSYYQSMPTTISFPSVFGIKPVEGDVVDLNFGYKSPSIKIDPIYVVGSINLSHSGQFYQMYQCNLQVAPFNVTDIEKQISEY